MKTTILKPAIVMMNTTPVGQGQTSETVASEQDAGTAAPSGGTEPTGQPTPPTAA